MDQNKSEQEKFLEDLDIKKEVDVLEQPLAESAEAVEVKEKEDTERKAKNRREKRLMEENQRLREEAIAATTRAQTLVEAKQMLGTEQAEFEKLALQIYGNDTPEKAAASSLLIKALQSVKDSTATETEERLVKRFESERTSEAEAVKREESKLDDILDTVEEDFGINMSNKDERNGFLTLLEKLSPKDKEGNIIEYADSESVAQLFLDRKERSSGRAKELASRSMTRSGASSESKLEDDAAVRFLKENGII